ncbi:hypothetical protein HW555_008305 [Spodoptera exigua]|uniref:Uncharacterized protein n=1 Tax=Spodoptera exigua TaxID=7107 RepID=A0A835GDC3_SPOEX|nr:hypothetical protein HW555_008305 [Spodoptera exigua]
MVQLQPRAVFIFSTVQSPQSGQLPSPTSNIIINSIPPTLVHHHPVTKTILYIAAFNIFHQSLLVNLTIKRTTGAEWWSLLGMKQSQAGGPGEDRAEPGPARPPQERRALSLMLRMDRFSPP